MLTSSAAFCFLLWIAASVTPTAAGGATKKVVCYYTNWSMYRQGPARFSPENIDPTLCTHILYAFGAVDKTAYTLGAGDTWSDIGLGGFSKMVAMKEVNPDLKVLLAVGGWNMGAALFSEISASSENIRTFVNSVVSFLRSIQFDGLDVDWEYPAVAEQGGRPQDTANLDTLLRALADAFIEEARSSGNERLLLSAAVPATNWFGRHFNVAEVCSCLDFVNLMAYDFHGPWSSTGPNSALHYKRGTATRGLNTADSINYWLQRGCTKDKLVVGVPFYGRTWVVNGDAYNPASPWGMWGYNGRGGRYTKMPGVLAYYEMCPTNGHQDAFDSDFKVAYGIRSDNTFYTYNNPETMALKREYVASRDLAGVMVWDLSFDDFNGELCNQGRYPLLTALVRGSGTSPTSSPATTSSTIPTIVVPDGLGQSPATPRTTTIPGYNGDDSSTDTTASATTIFPDNDHTKNPNSNTDDDVITETTTSASIPMASSGNELCSLVVDGVDQGCPRKPQPGLFEDPSNHRGFVVCVGYGRKYTFTCAPGTVFKSCRCNHP